MIDTHAHLFDDDFDSDIEQVIMNSKQSGITSIIMPAIEPKTFEKMLRLAESDEMLYCSIGIHPHNASEVNDDSLKLIESYINNPKVKAIGEIGLDYYYNFAPREVQVSAFEKQIEIAKKFGIPIIVHNRESDEDLIKVLSNTQNGALSGVLHCFSGNIDMMKKAVNLGFYISFTGNITFKKAEELRNVVKETPLDRILLETDSPWMAPVPYRGKRNEPKFINSVAEKISEIKLEKLEKVIEMTSYSAKKLFKLALLLFLLITIINNIPVFSQNNNFDENADSLIDKQENPYCKWVGIAPIIGTNTEVNTYISNDQDVSNDGLLAIGFGVFSNPIEWLFLEFAYLHYNNKAPNEKSDGILAVEQNDLFELGGGIILNPAGKVNVYGLLGYSNVTSKYSMYNWDEKKRYPLQSTRNGFFSGLGFFANFPINNAGTFVLNAEWRLNFILENTKLKFDPRIDYKDPNYLTPTEYSTFFSIPRISIIWYPPIDEWFFNKNEKGL